MPTTAPVLLALALPLPLPLPLPLLSGDGWTLPAVVARLLAGSCAASERSMLSLTKSEVPGFQLTLLQDGAVARTAVLWQHERRTCRALWHCTLCPPQLHARQHQAASHEHEQ